MDLTEIHSPADIKGMSIDELEQLADSLRSVLLTKLSTHGGHTGPNLGFLEATIAMHYVFNSPVDKIVYDVSHQSYVHKMLTGRIAAFTDPAHYDDVTGYTNPGESEHDFFTIGHTSTAVSLAGGLAKARDLQGGTENIIAVIGDGSLSGGEAFEGLDYGATLGTNFIVVVNDNDMSIAENHGGLYADLHLLRSTDGTADNNYFRSLGYAYRYVRYGNDLRSLIKAFSEVKDYNRPVVVHLNTQKGNGYAPAEANREKFHYAAPFNLETGEMVSGGGESYDDIFSAMMLDKMKNDKRVAVITAGTPGVLGFTPEKRREAGRQFIDVGIAEQEAVALASGMAKGGCRPVFGVVSSFLQRAYDQLSQDVAINNTPVVLNIFYGSVAGMTDVTHLGWFDIALVANIPGWVYLAPTCKEEYVAMLDWAVRQTSHPVAVRVPGVMASCDREFPADYDDLNRNEVVCCGSRVAVIAAGTCLKAALEAADKLKAEGVDITVINPRFLSGIDTELLDSLKADHELVITLEDGVIDGGYGEKVARYYGDSDMKVMCRGVKKEFLDRYDIGKVLADSGLTADAVVATIKKAIK
ncbi:MAG: 1-deoxy-D-xylulose-5-phosphate synthase [Muribaculaceae bacterium]|nr:1-deoxy-D-xylulose-5-phosphate synthase [Muribaculaceae bacterium]